MATKILSIKDMREQAQRTGCSQFSFFLDPKECMEIQESHPEAVLWGGYEDAERKMVCFPADWDMEPQFPMQTLQIKVKNKKAELSHRDCLGSLMQLGMDRSCFGDIVKMQDGFIIFATEAAASFVKFNLEKVGREGVLVLENEETITVPEREFREEKRTVASKRLDCVVAAFLNVSRTKALEYLRQERVTLNYSVVKDADKQVNDGAVISVRGHGKAKLHFTGDTSRKGRLYLEILYYI